MEFLKMFEEAKKLGMTKEEFLPIWELELRRKQLDEGGGAVLQSMDLSSNQSESSDDQFSQLNLSKPWQQLKEELHQDLQVKLQYMFNDMIEKQELHWKQLWHKNDQLWNELRNNFGILSTHISNTSETHTSSLKLFLMQEITLLEQDLKKIIEKHNTENVQQEIMSQKQDAIQDCQDPCKGAKEFYEKNITGDKGAETAYHSQQVLNDKQSRSHQQKQVEKQQLLSPDPSFGFHVEKQKRKPISKDLQCVGSINVKHGKAVGETKQNEHSQPHPTFSHIPDNVKQGKAVGETKKNEHSQPHPTFSHIPDNVKQGKAVGETKKNEHSQSHPTFSHVPDLLNSGLKTSDKQSPKSDLHLNTSSSSVSTDVPSITATGSYAEAIAKQMKALSLTNLNKTNSTSTGKGHDGSFSKKEVFKRQTSSPSNNSQAGGEMNDVKSLITNIPTHFTTFTINNSDAFTASHEEYVSPFYYTLSRVCKIKLCLWFNVNCQLNVLLFVSNGKYDNRVKWPIRFTGSGFIFNETSQNSSQIWALGPLMCSKPEPGKDITVKTAVSLKTLRSNSPDVTYQTICEKGYALGQRLCFRWNLSAFEKPGI